MARSKEYKATLVTVTKGFEAIDDRLKISLPKNPRNHRQIDHSQYIGLGLDAWATQSLHVIDTLLAGGNYSVATLIGYSVNGLRFFIGFLKGGAIEFPPITPNELTKRHLERYISWLKLKYPSGSTAKNYYTSFKSLIVALAEYGFIESDIDDLLPPNPFPYSDQSTKDADPLSVGEMQRLLRALKSDLVAIHKNRFLGNSAEAMAVLLLLTAVRSGINTTPLLEMTRNALKSHPFMPNLRLITTIKRRGKGAQNKTVRQTNLIDTFSAVPLDGVAVLNKALELSKPLVALASKEISSYVWLYRSGQRGRADEIVSLTSGTLSVSAKRICVRHGLLHDEGDQLVVTLGRLRKTMESRLWKLSGGDILEVSSVMGHSAAVADNHYLRINDEIKMEGAIFVGEAFPEKLRGISITPTPPGGCKDSLYGSLAPKDGVNHCSEFIHCLGCPSYAIVGSLEDLHRLFSYQQFLHAEIAYLLTDEWEAWRARQLRYIQLIDDFTFQKFDKALVKRARMKAESEPHPFWAKKIEFMNKKMSGVI